VSLNVSKNPKIKRLKIEYNPIRSLTFPNGDKLKIAPYTGGIVGVALKEHFLSDDMIAPFGSSLYDVELYVYYIEKGYDFDNFGFNKSVKFLEATSPELGSLSFKLPKGGVTVTPVLVKS
jgi:hypothetical protein